MGADVHGPFSIRATAASIFSGFGGSPIFLAAPKHSEPLRDFACLLARVVRLVSVRAISPQRSLAAALSSVFGLAFRPRPNKRWRFSSLPLRVPALRRNRLACFPAPRCRTGIVAARRLKEQGLNCGRRRAAGGAREDGADRRPPRWFRLLRRITQRGRARHAILTYARRMLRLREMHPRRRRRVG